MLTAITRPSVHGARLMTLDPMSITQSLAKIENGDPFATRELFTLVYEELRRIAARQMAGEKPGQTLQVTALVHEAFLKLVGDVQSVSFSNRRHFFVAAANAMRRLLIDRARSKGREKRGGDRMRVDAVLEQIAETQDDERLLALNEALERFSQKEPEKAELVKLRWFAGQSMDQIAKLLEISPTTADRWWAYARAWLRAEAGDE